MHISHLCQSCSHNIVNTVLNYDIGNWEERHLVSFLCKNKQITKTVITAFPYMITKPIIVCYRLLVSRFQKEF